MAPVMPEDQENRLYLTNNFSIVSKYSAVKNQYFSDPILEDFIENWIRPKSWRRAPIVNRGYAARILAMDWAVDRTIRCHNVGCAIILGAGYDMLSLRRLNQTCWVEIDLPKVAQVKIEFIKAKHNLQPGDIRQDNDCIFSIQSLNYHLISCDISDSAALRKQLDTVTNLVNIHLDVVIVNEVCLCYIDTESIETILRTVIDSVRDTACRLHYIGYEQIKPVEGNKYFGDLMLSHFSAMGHPLKHYPTSEEVRDLFKRTLSFHHVTMIGMHNAFHNVLSEQVNIIRGFSEEPFDEFEEMDQYLAHYKLTMAIMVIKDPFMGLVTAKPQDEADLCENTEKHLKLNPEIDHATIANIHSIPNRDLQRFGHASCMLDHQSFLVTGGFGTPITQNEGPNASRQHARIPDCTLLRFVDTLNSGQKAELKQIPLQGLPTDQIRLDRMHGQVTHLGNGRLFFNGGRQSPKCVKSKNESFIAALDSTDGLKLLAKIASMDTPIWRHRQVPISDDSVVQIGGISDGTTSLEDCIKVCNFSSSKFGYQSLPTPSSNADQGTCDKFIFRRHSFGLDVSPNGSTLFLWGGLQTRPKYFDKPVDSAWSKFLWDMRSDTVTAMSSGTLAGDNDNGSGDCYGPNIHFISDNQLIRIGGIDCRSGLEFGWDKCVELYDLRNAKSLFIDLHEKVEGKSFTLTNATTCKSGQTSEIVTIGGGGNYFTFGTCFQDSHLVYKYSAA